MKCNAVTSAPGWASLAYSLWRTHWTPGEIAAHLGEQGLHVTPRQVERVVMERASEDIARFLGRGSQR
jgi:hypothetical protein